MSFLGAFMFVLRSCLPTRDVIFAHAQSTGLSLLSKTVNAAKQGA